MRPCNIQAMTNIRIQPQIEMKALATVAELYPLAFAMVMASNSCAGLALRRREFAGLRSSRSGVDQSIASISYNLR